MGESRQIADPFLNKTVGISDKLTDRLRGKYAQGPTMANGEPEFGWRTFETPPIQKEAANEIDRLRNLLQLLHDKAEDQNVAHVEFRVKCRLLTADALSPKPDDGATP